MEKVLQESIIDRQARNRLILAVDTASLDEARRYLNELHEFVGMFKIGLQLYIHYGPEILKLFQSAGARIFLDCKFLDIPNTAARAAEEATAHGVQMFTVHACGGTAMLKATAAATKERAAGSGMPEPVILAVTLLTSISQEVLSSELNVVGSVEDYVLRMAKQCRACGITGLVASGQEAARLKQELGEEMVIVTPGVRPRWAAFNDQSRFTTPRQAIKNGSDYLVVGRPITDSKNPRDSARRIVAEIKEALVEIS